MPDDIRWAKFLTEMLKNPKLRIIKAMPEVGDAIRVIWDDLILMAADCNAGGYVFVSENIPYTDETLGAYLERPASIIRLALQTFTNLDMVTIDDKGIFLNSFPRIQNIEAMEKVRLQGRERKRRFDEKKKRDVIMLNSGTDEEKSNVTVTLRNGTDKIREDKNIIREEYGNIYSNLIDSLKKTVTLPNFNTYYSALTLVDITDSEFIIGVPDENTASYIETNAANMLERFIAGETGLPLKLKMVLVE